MRNDRLHLWITAYRTAWWNGRIRRALVWTLPSTPFIGAIALILENFFRLSSPVRWALLVLAVLPLLAWLGFALFALFRSRQNLVPNDSTLARHFRSLPGGHGRVLNAVELQDDPSPLAELAIERLVAEIERLNPANFLSDKTPLQRFYRRLGAGIAIIVFCLVLPGGRDAFARLMHPGTDFHPPAPYRIEWTENTEEYAFGEPFVRTITIIAEAISKTPTDGEALVTELNGGKSQTIPLHFTNNLTELRLTDASGVLEITPKVGSITGEKRTFTPFYRIRVSESKLLLTPPGYSGMPPREITTGSDQAVLAGTKLEWSAHTTGEIGSVMLLFHSGEHTDTIGVKYDSKSLQTGFTLRNAGTLQMVLRDANGRNGAPPPLLKFDILPDESPRVTLLSPDVDGDMPGNFQLPVIARADDDFGIGAAYLIFRSIKSGTPGNWDSLKLPLQKIEPASAGAAIQWDASRYDLMPDDGAEFFVSAYDQNTVTGPGRGISDIRKMKVPSLEQWMKEADASHDAITNDLKSLSQNGERVAQSLETLAEKMKRKGDLSHEEREQLRTAGERQQELVDKTEKAAKDLRQLSKKLEESGAAAQETMEKLSRLQELMDELASPELKDALKQLQEALKKLDANQIRNAMQDVKLSQQEWKEKLDRTLALLEQLRLERRLDMLEQWSKKVAEQARRNDMAIDSLKHNSAAQDSLAREQSKLANESKGLEEQTAETAKDAEKNSHLDSIDAQTLSNATNPDQAASQKLGESSKSLQQQQSSAGSQQSKQGAQRAEQLAQKLSEMNKKLRENGKKDLADKMNRRIGELLELSHTQQELTDQYNALDARTPQARMMAERQEAIRRGLQNTIDSIGTLGRETFFLPRGLLADLQGAEATMENATVNITERLQGLAKQPQVAARAQMTEGAARLMQAQGEMEKSSSSTGYEEMMKALSEMARKQAEINDKTGDMAGQQGMPTPGTSGDPMDMSGGSQPGGSSGQGSALQQLAAEQGALSNMMNQLEQQSKQMRDLTGRLDGLGEEMKDSEKQLHDKIVNDRTQRLQQHILTRLLDAQRSLQRQDYTQKRESKTGTDIGGRVTISYDPNSIENQLRQRLLELSRMGVDPLWQQRIRSYWQSLQQSSEPTEPAAEKTDNEQ